MGKLDIPHAQETMIKIETLEEHLAKNQGNIKSTDTSRNEFTTDFSNWL